MFFKYFEGFLLEWVWNSGCKYTACMKSKYRARWAGDVGGQTEFIAFTLGHGSECCRWSDGPSEWLFIRLQGKLIAVWLSG